MKTSHFPDIELCKRLTEYGFPMTEKFHMNGGIWDSLSDRWMSEYASWCPSIAELLDELPVGINISGDEKHHIYNLRIIRREEGLFVYYNPDEYIYRKSIFPSTHNLTLPNALAEMWLWLKENNYLPHK